MSQVRALRKLMGVQTKLYLREPIAFFFTLVFAPLLLVVMGFIFGKQPAPGLGGLGYLDIFVPQFAAIAIGVVGLACVPIDVSNRRDAGVLRRFRATPLRPLLFIVGDVVVYFALTLVGVLLLVLLGTAVYRVRFEGSLLAFTAGICLSTAAFLALGYLIAALVRGARAAAVVGNVLLYVMNALAGTTVPLDIMPDVVRTVARFIPLTHVVTLLRGLWVGESFAEHYMEVAVLGGILVVGTIIAVRAFHWE